MAERLFNVWTKLRASLWFIPTLLALAGIGLAFGAVRFDQLVPLEEDGLWSWVLGGGAEGAASVLSTVAASMITVTGVVFSITIVALSLASAEFGPRLLRNFMRDRGNQFVLGIFIATFLYCVTALVALDRDPAVEAAPRTVVVVALVLTLLSVAVLIFFIHHISVSIQADTVIHNVSCDLDERIRHYYPEDVGTDGAAVGAEVELPEWDKEAEVIAAPKTGYVEAVEAHRLLKIATQKDLIIRVTARPGAFIVEGFPLMEVWPKERVEGDLRKRLGASMAIGKHRTEEQDVEFALDQLVEVAVRALSPGTNDPFTAITSIDHIGSALCAMARRNLPSPYRYHDGRLRLVLKRSSFAGVVDAAFDPLRQYSTSAVPVVTRLLTTLHTVADCVHGEEEREVLRRHGEKIIQDARVQEHDPSDQEALERAYGRLVAALDA